MKYLLIFGISFLFIGLSTSCSVLEVDSPRYTSLPVRDVPLETRKDNTYRKKLLVLPILSPDIDVVTLGKIQNNFTSKIDEVGYYQVVLPDEINLEVSHFVTDNNKYNISKLAEAVKKNNISAFVIVIVEDLKYYRIGDKLGVFRQIENKLDAKTRVAVVSASTSKDVFKALKESSVTMNTQRVITKPHTDGKIFADPRMAEMAVNNALDEVVPKMSKSLESLAWEGRIARVEGERIFLNVGRKSGVQIGDILKVIGKKEDVFDPQKGEYLGKSPGRVKGLVEIKAYLENNGSIAVIYSGAGFSVNDTVEVY